MRMCFEFLAGLALGSVACRGNCGDDCGCGERREGCGRGERREGCGCGERREGCGCGERREGCRCGERRGDGHGSAASVACSAMMPCCNSRHFEPTMNVHNGLEACAERCGNVKTEVAEEVSNADRPCKAAEKAANTGRCRHRC